MTMAQCEICGDEFLADKRQRKRCSRSHMKPCASCGNDFLLTPMTPKTRSFCSKACVAASQKRVTKCPVCGTEFTKRAKTCSRACSVELRNRTVGAQVKVCPWCSKEFTALSTTKYCDGPHYAPCKVCGGDFEVNPYNPRLTCSDLCNGQLVNTPESNAKRKETSLKNWGTDFPFQAAEVKEKIKASNQERYGVDWGLSSEEIRAKGFETSISIYGHKWPRQHGETKEKAEKTNIERYGVPNVFMSPEVQRKARQTFIERYGDGAAPHPRISTLNRHMAASLEKEFEVEVTFEASLGDVFVDLKVDDRLYLDLHPTVSHNALRSFVCNIKGCKLPCELHEPLARDYHYKRALAAREANVTLIQWYGWEDEASLLKLLSGKLRGGFRKYSARKLKLRTVTSKEANGFLGEHHVQGSARSQDHRFGLFHEGELVAVATFGRNRFGGGANWEFLRYAVKEGVIVHGGAGRLFEAFVEAVSPTSVVSYVDFNHTTRESTFLSSLGFEEVKPTGPALVWHRVSDGMRVKHTSLLAVGADRLLGTSYGRFEQCGLNNDGIMMAEGFLPVYTAGNRVFHWGRHL